VQLTAGLVLFAAGDLARAERHLRTALRPIPADHDLRLALGSLCARKGALAEAEVHLRAAVKDDDRGGAGNNLLGGVLQRLGRRLEAIHFFCAALRQDDRFVSARCNLASALYEAGNVPAAMAEYHAADQIDPGWEDEANTAARALATHPDPARRDPGEGLRLARQVCQATHDGDPDYLLTLSICAAETGLPSEALAAARRGLELVGGDPSTKLHRELLNQLRACETQLGDPRLVSVGP
jgi:tetratricopeptide (TPR) repeat protein